MKLGIAKIDGVKVNPYSGAELKLKVGLVFMVNSRLDTDGHEDPVS